MHRDELIITVFTLCPEGAHDLLPIGVPSGPGGQRLRQRGPQPTLAGPRGHPEVLTIEAVGSFLGFTQDRTLWRYFRDHWSHFFPGLTQIHRTTFVRQAAQLWACKALLWQGVLALTPHDPELAGRPLGRTAVPSLSVALPAPTATAALPNTAPMGVIT